MLKNIINSCLLLATLLSYLTNCLSIQNNLDMLKREETKMIKALAGSAMTNLVIEAGAGDTAQFKFGCKSNFYSFAANGATQNFSVSHAGEPLVSINKEDEILMQSSKVKVPTGIDVSGEFRVRDVPQWRLLHEENFSSEASGWTNNTVTECGGVHMLGGYCQFGQGEVSKTFNITERHSHVRIEATYHFIDAWDTESGYMRLDHGSKGELQYAWIERYSAFSGDYGINVCGGRWPEGKFASPINVAIPHSKSTLKIGFGATIEQDPCDESFGVSGLRIYIK